MRDSRLARLTDPCPSCGSPVLVLSPSCPYCAYPVRAALHVEVVAGPDVGRRFLLRPGMVIGRDPMAGAVLSDPAVSRRHAAVAFAEGSWALEDLGSSNGIARNGERVVRARFRPGDRLTLGDTEMVMLGEHPLLGAEVSPDAIRPPVRRGRWAVAVAAAVMSLAAVGSGIAWFIVASRPAEGPSAPPFTDADRIRLERGLSSQDPTELQEAVHATLVDALGDAAELMLPQGTQVTVEEGSFEDKGPALAWVTVRLQGAPGGRWRVLLVAEDGRWKALGTERLR